MIGNQAPAIRARVALLLAFVSAVETFKFVYIPCDASMPMQEWELQPRNQEDHIGCLTQHLQKWYRKSGRLTSNQKSELAELVKMQTREKYGDEAEKFENFENLDIGKQLLDGETVEIVTLLPPIEQFGYVSVAMYIDDRGYIRQLPQNARATSLMHAVSNRDGAVLGDAFIGRSYDNEMDEFTRLDMCVSDLSSDAGWVKLCQEFKRESTKNADKTHAAMEALKNHQQPHQSTEDVQRQQMHEEANTMVQALLEDEENPLTRDGYQAFPGKQTPQPVTETECADICHEIREMAKSAFDSGNMELALRKYAKAKRYLVHMHHLSRDAGNQVPESEKNRLLTSCELNMALAYLKVGKWKQCEQLCKEVLQREPGNMKALYRLGCAQRDYGDIDVARQTFQKALSLAPSDPTVKKGLALCNKKQRVDTQKRSGLAKKMFGSGFGSIYPSQPKEPGAGESVTASPESEDTVEKEPKSEVQNTERSDPDEMCDTDGIQEINPQAWQGPRKDQLDANSEGQQNADAQLEEAVQAVSTMAKDKARKARKNGEVQQTEAEIEEAIENLRNLRKRDGLPQPEDPDSEEATLPQGCEGPEKPMA